MGKMKNLYIDKMNMTPPLYSQYILDPKSQAVQSYDKYYVCKLIDNQWHIIEGARTSFYAFQARKTLMEHDTGTDYKVFKKGLNEVRRKL